LSPFCQQQATRSLRSPAYFSLLIASIKTGTLSLFFNSDNRFKTLFLISGSSVSCNKSIRPARIKRFPDSLTLSIVSNRNSGSVDFKFERISFDFTSIVMRMYNVYLRSVMHKLFIKINELNIPVWLKPRFFQYVDKDKIKYLCA